MGDHPGANAPRGNPNMVMGTTTLADLENLNLISKGSPAPSAQGNRNLRNQEPHQIQRLQAELNEIDDEQLSSIFQLALDENEEGVDGPPGFTANTSSKPPGFQQQQPYPQAPPPRPPPNMMQQPMQMPRHPPPRHMYNQQRQMPRGQFPPNMGGARGQFPPNMGARGPRGQSQFIPNMGGRGRGMPPPDMNMRGMNMNMNNMNRPRGGAGGWMPPPGQPHPQHQVKDPYSFELFTNPNAGGRIRLNDSYRMKGYELFNLIRFQQSAGQSGDDYSDNYYLYKLAEEKQRSSLRAGIKSASGSSGTDISAESIRESTLSSRPGNLLQEMMVLHNEGVKAIKPSKLDDIMSSTPLPELPGSVHMPKEYEVMRNKAAKEWHSTNKVLGNAPKSNLKTPKKLMEFSPTSPAGSAGGISSEVFATPEWKLRRLAADVADIIIEIEDLHRLLKAKMKVLGGNFTGDVANASQSVITELETKQVTACDKLGTLLGFTSVATGTSIELNDVQLRGVLWTNKGRRLVCRAAGCLLPMHHSALMDAVAKMMVYFVCLSPEGLESDNVLEKEKAEIDMYTAQHIAVEFTTLSLERTIECLRMFLACQTPDSLRAVIATPGGAELVRSVLMHGQKKSEETGKDKPVAKEWSNAFAEFLKMAEAGISASA